MSREKKGKSKVRKIQKVIATGMATYQILNPYSSIFMQAGPRIASAESPDLFTNDVTRPSIMEFVPWGSGVSVLSNFDIRFDESVLLDQYIGSLNIYKRYGTSYYPVSSVHFSDTFLSGGTVSIHQNVVTIDPAYEFDENSEYKAILVSGSFVDIAGNLTYSGSTFFKTEYYYDAPPTMLWHSSVVGDTSGQLAMMFSEPTVLRNGYISIYKEDHDFNLSNDEHIYTMTVNNGSLGSGGTARFSGASNKWTLIPNVVLEHGSEYYLHISSGVFQDFTSNHFPAITDSTSWSFQVQDMTPPRIIGNDVSGSVNDFNIQVFYNENLYANYGQISFLNTYTNKYDHKMYLSGPDTSGGIVLISGNVVTIRPDFIPEEGARYSVRISSGAFMDGFTNSTSRGAFSYRLFDENTPILLEYWPKGNEMAAENTNFSLMFNEPVLPNRGGTVDFYLVSGSTSPVYQVKINNQGSYQNGAYIETRGNSFVINPTVDLAPGRYYILISSGAIIDRSRNAFSGIKDKAEWDFRIHDTKLPYVESTLPQQGGYSDVPQNIKLTFNEDIHLGQGAIIISDHFGGDVLQTIHVTGSMITGGEVEINGKVVTITPNQPFTDLNYRIDIPAGTFVDHEENPSVSKTLTFFTRDHTAPSLVKSWPNGLTGPNEEFGLLFSEPVSLRGGKIKIYQVNNDEVVHTISVNYNNVSGASYRFSGGRAMFFKPYVSLVEGMDYYITVSSGVFFDYGNHRFPGISDKTTWDFTVADIRRPHITGSSYYYDSNTGVRIYVDETVQGGNGIVTLTDEVTDNVVHTIQIAGNTVTGANMHISGGVVTLKPSITLGEDKEYRLDFSSGAFLDLAGNLSYNSQIYIYANDVTAPQLTSYTPDNIAAQSGAYTLAFNENVRLGNGQIQIHRASNDEVVHTLSIADDEMTGSEYHYISGATLVFRPSIMLEDGVAYYVTVSPGTLIDNANHAFAGLSDKTLWDFTVDGKSPSLMSFMSEGYGAVASDALEIQFDEPIKPGVDSIIRFNTVGDGVYEPERTISYRNGSWSGATVDIVGNKVAIQLDRALTEGRVYSVGMDRGMFTDEVGNEASGGAALFETFHPLDSEQAYPFQLSGGSLQLTGGSATASIWIKPSAGVTQDGHQEFVVFQFIKEDEVQQIAVIPTTVYSWKQLSAMYTGSTAGLTVKVFVTDMPLTSTNGIGRSLSKPIIITLNP
jgi:hypothetical protein